jgi:hypothetical protein
MIHQLNTEGNYDEFLNAESLVPNWTEWRIFEHRIGLHIEISKADLPNTDLDLMPNFRMGLNVEISNANRTEGRNVQYVWALLFLAVFYK